MDEPLSLPTRGRRLDLVFERADDFRREFEVNLCKGGAFVPTPDSFELLEPVEVWLEAPFAGEKLRLRAEVVHWQPNGGVSVQFLDPTPLLRARLSELFEQAEALAPAPIDDGPEDEPYDLSIVDLDESDLEDFSDTGVAQSQAPDTDHEKDPNARTHQVRAERSPTRVDLFLQRRGGSRFQARSRNLSSSGLLVSVPGEDLPIGSELSLTLVHPSGEAPFDVPATVMRHLEGHGVVSAVALQMHPGDRQSLLDSFVDEVRALHDERQRNGIHERIGDGGAAKTLRLLSALSPRGTVTISTGVEEGTILFDSRQLLEARLGPVRGLKALARMLAWREGFLEFYAEIGTLPHLDAPVPMEQALEEAERRLEESRQCAGPTLAPDTRFVLDRQALASLDRPPAEAEASVLELAAAGVTLRRILDWMPESDAHVQAAVAGLIERRLLSEGPR
jgi:hypothetical protein